MGLDGNRVNQRLSRWYRLEKMFLFAYLGIGSLLFANLVVVTLNPFGLLYSWGEVLRISLFHSPFAGWIIPFILGLYAVAFLCLLATLVVDLWIRSQRHLAARRLTTEYGVPTIQEPQLPSSLGCFTWGLTFLLVVSFVVTVHGNTMTLFAPYNIAGTPSLYSVGVVSSRSAWAVGEFFFDAGGTRGVIWHYDGQAWKSVTDPSVESLDSVSMLPSGEGWAVGADGVILHERGNIWQPVPSPTRDPLFGVAMRSTGEGWAVGGVYQTPISIGLGAHLLTRAARPGIPAPGEPLSPHDRITCTILHYLAGTWSQVHCPVKFPLRSVTALPDGEAWAVGREGEIVHEVGGIWSAISSPSVESLDGVAMLSSAAGWAVGGPGFSGPTILRYERGAWRPVDNPTQEELSSVVILSSGDGWAVGDSSTILRYSQGQWRLYPSVTAPDEALFDVTFLPGGQEGWIVGSDGIVLHFEGGVWKAYRRIP